MMIKTQYRKEISLEENLSKGAQGAGVKKVQEWLNLWRYVDPQWRFIIAVDGDFGDQTDKAIRLFQQQYGLTADGVVGAKTYWKLTEPMIKAFTRIKDVTTLRDLIVAYAKQHLANRPRELNNSNNGPWVRAYMDGNEGKDWAWCMGFVQTILDQAFHTLNGGDVTFQSIMPKTYSCDIVGEYGRREKKLLLHSDVKGSPKKITAGDIFLKVKSANDWVHTGIITEVENKLIHTIEGNTNDEGVREGFEVCQRIRDISKENLDIFKVA